MNTIYTMILNVLAGEYIITLEVAYTISGCKSKDPADAPEYNIVSTACMSDDDWLYLHFWLSNEISGNIHQAIHTGKVDPNTIADTIATEWNRLFTEAFEETPWYEQAIGEA